MEYEKIKQLIDDMGNSKLSSISIDFPDGTKISMAKEEKILVTASQEDVVKQTMPREMNNETAQENQSTEKENIKIVKSPMVGTFYSKPSPTAESYVEVGKEVKVGETLCIIEAMKLMNEIESEFDGEVVDILVHDEEAVDYGKELFIIK